jgi:hypothetical protein
MRKLAVLNSFAALLILSVALMLFAGPAQAYVYDDFTSNGINTNLWTNMGPDSNLFSQPGNGDTYLYFSSITSQQKDILSSKNPVSGAFFVAMQYSSFQATNTAEPYHSSGVHLYLSYGTNIVDVDRLNYSNANFFQGFSTITGFSDPISSTVDHGWLGIGYNGIPGLEGQVTVWYDDAGAGWHKLATYAPNFNGDPYFSIMGKTQTSSTLLSFQVNQVQLTHTPVPPSVLLLGTGLLGLAGWRRFRKS